jgi:hypothetical protein
VVTTSRGIGRRKQIEAFRPPLPRASAGARPWAQSRAVTQRISDLVPDADVPPHALFNDYYREIRIDRCMAVPIHVRKDVIVSFVLNRSGRDFSDRDRECLEAIRRTWEPLSTDARCARPAAAWGVPRPIRLAIRD